MMKNLLLLMIAVAALCSCSITQPVWDGTKEGVGTVVDTGESLVSTVWYDGVHQGIIGAETLITSGWNGTKSVVGSVVGAGEGAVNGAYDFVTDPFTGDDE